MEDQLRQVEHQLTDIQEQMHSNPKNLVYAEKEHAVAEYLTKIKDDYASYTSQRAKINFSCEKVKASMWSLDDDKTLGLDGYSSGYFKAAWNVAGKDIVKAIQNFFENGNLLKAWNVTAITLFPKNACPNDPGDFRPISYCHVIYKCLSKLICSKMKLVLNDIILHNILHCQDLVKHYEWKNYSANCLLKIYLQKANEMMDRDFIKDMMIALNFLENFVPIVYTCISTA